MGHDKASLSTTKPKKGASRRSSKRSRTIPASTRFELVARSAGRCQFDTCGADLFVHHITKRGGFWGNHAHIQAFSDMGPRHANSDASKIDDPHAIDNIMLLCRDCHAQIDDDEEAYPVELLRRWKREQEDRVNYLLSLPLQNETTIVELWTNVADPPVVRTEDTLVGALLPHYPARERVLIDLASLDLDPTLVAAATAAIQKKIKNAFASGAPRPPHVAVFGLTSIPLLAHLGACLGSHINARLFQYHRDSKDWRWKNEPPRAKYDVIRIQTGTNPRRVAITLNLSGTIDPHDIHETLDDSYTIYSLSLVSDTPNVDFLRTIDDLQNFRASYRKLLARIQNEHGSIEELAVLPAVPIPIAIALGIDRLPKVGPALVVYDKDKREGARGYTPVLRID